MITIEPSQARQYRVASVLHIDDALHATRLDRLLASLNGREGHLTDLTRLITALGASLNQAYGVGAADGVHHGLGYHLVITWGDLRYRIILEPLGTE